MLPQGLLAYVGVPVQDDMHSVNLASMSTPRLCPYELKPAKAETVLPNIFRKRQPIQTIDSLYGMHFSRTFRLHCQYIQGGTDFCSEFLLPEKPIVSVTGLTKLEKDG